MRGWTRTAAATVVGLAAKGMTADDIRALYSQFAREDVEACPAYMARSADESERSRGNQLEGLTIQRAEELIAEIRAGRDAR